VRRICDILQNDELASKMSEAGPGYVQQHFDIVRCTEKIENLYDDVLSMFREARGIRKRA
jgi:glycosyltransferase involved in cell wall biosynthesis